MKVLWQFDSLVHQIMTTMTHGDARAVAKVEERMVHLKKQGLFASFSTVDELLETFNSEFSTLYDLYNRMEETLKETNVVLNHPDHSFSEWRSLNRQATELFKSYKKEVAVQRKTVNLIVFVGKMYLIQKALLDSNRIEERRRTLGDHADKTYPQLMEEAIAENKRKHAQSLQKISNLNAEMLDILSQDVNADLTSEVTEKTTLLQEELQTCEALRQAVLEAESEERGLGTASADMMANLQLEVAENLAMKELELFKKRLISLSRHPLSAKHDGVSFNVYDKEQAKGLSKRFRTLLKGAKEETLC